MGLLAATVVSAIASACAAACSSPQTRLSLGLQGRGGRENNKILESQLILSYCLTVIQDAACYCSGSRLIMQYKMVLKGVKNSIF